MKLPSIPAAMVDKDHVPLSEEPLHKRFARAVLMMLPPGRPWSDEDHIEWRKLTGTPRVSSERLKEMARLVLEEKVP